MPIKRLFNEQDSYNSDAERLVGELTNAIRPILTKYAQEGYSMRDAMNVAFGVINLEGVAALIKAKRDAKEKDNKPKERLDKL